MSGPGFPDVPLLPCPFCGLAGTWFRTGRDVGVECADGADCPGRAQTNVYEPEHAPMAAGCWNTRNDQAADHYATVLETRDELLAALQSMHRICRDCDLEVQAARPTEEQYGAAMDAAEAAIAKATGVPA